MYNPLVKINKSSRSKLFCYIDSNQLLFVSMRKAQEINSVNLRVSIENKIHSFFVI